MSDRRRYIRIRTVFPVLISPVWDRDPVVSLKRYQGFTKDISQHGLCVEVNELGDLNPIFFQKGLELKIDIEVPFRQKALSGRAHIIWLNQDSGSLGVRYLLGVQWIDNINSDHRLLFQFAKRSRRHPYFIWGTITILVITLVIYYAHYQSLWLSMLRKDFQFARLQSSFIQLCKERDQLRTVRISFNKEAVLFQKKLVLYEKKQKEMEEKFAQYQKNLIESEQSKTLMAEKIMHLNQQILSGSAEEAEQLKKEKEAIRIREEEVSRKIILSLKIKEGIEHKLNQILNEKKVLASELSGIQEVQDTLGAEVKKLDAFGAAGSFQVVLKNGDSLTGELISLQEDSLELKVAGGVICLNRDQVIKIEKMNEKQRIEEKMKKENIIARDWEKTILKDEIAKQKKIFTGLSGSDVSVHDQRIYVQGELFYIKGMAYGIEYPKTPGGMKAFHKIPWPVFEKDFEMMKEAGVNVIRTYEPVNEAILDLARKNNIRVIETVCFPNELTDFNSPIHLKYHLEKAVETIRGHKKHPSILMWALWNDAPWVWGEIGSPFLRQGRQNIHDFLKKIHDAVKLEDPSHPITASNVPGFEGSDIGFDFLDVLGFNAYVGGMDCYVQEDAVSMIHELKAISERYHKPVVILETGFSTNLNQLDQGEVLSSQIKTIGESVSGVTIFQWADGWNKAGFIDRQDDNREEHWGIVTGYREPKSGYKMITDIFHSIPTKSKGYAEKKIENHYSI